MTHSEVCELVAEIKWRSHIHAQGVSPSKVLFGSLDDNKMALALKMFPVLDDGDKEVQYELDGLMYEARVYMDIIGDIIAQRRSPHFIPCVGFVQCSTDAYPNLKGAFDGLRSEIKKKRKSSKCSDQFMALLTEYDPSASSTFGSVFPELDETERCQMLFQIVYSILVMHSYRLVHHDLHQDNILVKKHAQPVTRFYRIMGSNGAPKTFKITSRYTPLIYDWDNAYCERLGPNKKMDSKHCKQSNMSNQFHPKFDLYAILGSTFYMDHTNPIAKMYFDDLARTKENNSMLCVSEKLFVQLKVAGDFRVQEEGIGIRCYEGKKVAASRLAQFRSDPGFIFDPDSDLWVQLIEQHHPIKKFLIAPNPGHSYLPTVFHRNWPSALCILENPIFSDFLVPEGSDIDPTQTFQGPNVAAVQDVIRSSQEYTQ